jgi:hypothetical protein
MKKLNTTPASFLETDMEESEVNDYDDDDEIIENKPKKNMKNFKRNNRLSSENDKELSLLQKNMSLSKSRATFMALKKNKKDKDKKKETPKNDEKTAIFRKMQMGKLQDSHTFTQSNRENIDEKYSRGMASRGNEKADEFVSFLGYLRDASFKASQLISKKEEQQLNKIFEGGAPKK